MEDRVLVGIVVEERMENGRMKHGTPGSVFEIFWRSFLMSDVGFRISRDGREKYWVRVERVGEYFWAHMKGLLLHTVLW
jgi:hypothetical protein